MNRVIQEMKRIPVPTTDYDMSDNTIQGLPKIRPFLFYIVSERKPRNENEPDINHDVIVG